MYSSILAYIPGEKIFKAMMDGEPVAYTIVGATILFALIVYFVKRVSRT